MTWPGRISPFRVCGAVGFALGFAVSLLLANARGLSLPVICGMTIVSACVFFALAMARKILTGRERLTYYHHEVAILGSNSLLLLALRQPVLVYLDVAVVGLGVFLAFGRLGCWLSGCCHGRPHRWGMRSADSGGWPLYGAGARLLPVQLLESGLVLAVVAEAIPMALRSVRPGEVLTWYTVTYGAGRFLLEFLRGDPERPYWSGVSEAQWTSTVLITAAAAGELAGVIPAREWHYWTAAGLTLVVITMALINSEAEAFFRPAHLSQVSVAVETACALSASTGVPHAGTTSMGLRISASPVDDGLGGCEVIAFSRPGGDLTTESALRLGRFIAQMRGGQAARLQPGSHGVYHLIVPFDGRSHAV